MNYRHHFHAGNFADLVKHAALLAVLDDLKGQGRKITFLDTHAGPGLYDLTASPAVRSGEAAAGIGRLKEGPVDPALAPLMQAVAQINAGAVTHYPGSPRLAAARLGRGDRLIACELNPEEAQALTAVLTRAGTRDGPRLDIRAADGFDAAMQLPEAKDRSTLVLIDPPYERGDDHDRVVQACAGLMRRNPLPCVVVWAPIKDLETLDYMLRRLEASPGVRGTAIETRLRPPLNPMKMNGCALILLNVSPAVRDAAIAAAKAVAKLCGDPNASVVVTALGIPIGEF
jgi:23S rRNA (adenine2030-N6)-methyltransferase